MSRQLPRVQRFVAAVSKSAHPQTIEGLTVGVVGLWRGSGDRRRLTERRNPGLVGAVGDLVGGNEHLCAQLAKDFERTTGRDAVDAIYRGCGVSFRLVHTGALAGGRYRCDCGGTRTFALRPRSELARDVSAQVPKRVGGIERWGYVHC